MFTQAYAYYTKLGWEVVPIDPTSKAPAVIGVTGKDGKPLDPSLADSLDHCSTALRMPENVIGIDVDQYEDKPGGETIAHLESQLGALPETWRSGSRQAPSGIYYYRLPAPSKLRGDLGKDSGVEIIQYHHRTAVVLPSVHPKTKKNYIWHQPSFSEKKVPSPSDLPFLPQEWFDFLKKREISVIETPNVEVTPELQAWADAIIADHLLALSKTKDGYRNIQINQKAFFLGRLIPRGILTKEEAQDKLNKIVDKISDSDELESGYKTVESGLLGGISQPYEPWPPFAVSQPPREFSQDGFGLADRFVHETNGRVRWVSDASKWAVFTGQEWRIGGNLAQYEARKVIENMFEREMAFYPSASTDPKVKSPREKFREYSNKLRDVTTGIRPTLDNAASAPDLAIDTNDFDSDPMKMKVLNGVLDLNTRKLTDFSVNDLMTKSSSAMYDPEATCPEFLKYLEKVQPDPEVRAFLQRWAGYCLTGLMDEQKFVIHQGLPGTGKSVYLDVFGHIAGGYFAAANPDVFHRTAQSQHLTAVASLAGARFIQANESTAGRKLDEAMVNALVSHEPVVARKMGQDEWSFKPTGKINYVTNHKPGINPSSGVWRRLALVRWNVVIPESEIVQDLGKVLVEDELSGILNWALEGLDDWIKGEIFKGRHRRSLKIPLSMQMDVAEYKADEDWLGSFILDECVQGDEFKETSKNLHKRYFEWAHDNGEQMPLKSNSFTKALEEAGWKRYRTGGERGFEGLKLRSEAVKAMVYEDDKPTKITESAPGRASFGPADFFNLLED